MDIGLDNHLFVKVSDTMYYRRVPPITPPPPFCLHLTCTKRCHLAYNNMKPFFRDSLMIFINCLRQYNEIHVITKPSSSTCQVCVSAVRGGLLVVLYGTTNTILYSGKIWWEEYLVNCSALLYNTKVVKIKFSGVKFCS